MSLQIPTRLIITHLSRLADSFKPGSQSHLHCRCSTPAMRIYLRHLVQAFRLEGPDLLYALVYLKRLRHSRTQMSRAQRCTPYRLVLAALVVAHKYLRDNSYKNVVWGRGYNLSTFEMDKVELAMLKLLDWRLRVSDDEQRAVELSIVGSIQRSTQCEKLLRREDAVLGKLQYIPVTPEIVVK